MTLEAAQELAQVIADAFGTDKLAGARVTVELDADKADAALADRRHVVLLGPPEVTFDTYSVATDTWTATLIAVPAGDRLKAWAALDQLLAVLAAIPLNLGRVTPAEWTPATGGVYGAYLATFTTDHTI